MIEERPSEGPVLRRNITLNECVKELWKERKGLINGNSHR